MASLGVEYPKMQEAVRELIESYREIGDSGKIGIIILKDVLKRADEAAVSGDLIAMINMYEEMRECK